MNLYQLGTFIKANDAQMQHCYVLLDIFKPNKIEKKLLQRREMTFRHL